VNQFAEEGGRFDDNLSQLRNVPIVCHCLNGFVKTSTFLLWLFVKRKNSLNKEKIRVSDPDPHGSALI
jgi:hypothetical protein